VTTRDTENRQGGHASHHTPWIVGLISADLPISKHGGQGSRNAAPHKPSVLAAGTAAGPPRRGSVNRRRADQRHHTTPPQRSAAAARPAGTCCVNHDQRHRRHQRPTPDHTIRDLLLSRLNLSAPLGTVVTVSGGSRSKFGPRTMRSPRIAYRPVCRPLVSAARAHQHRSQLSGRLSRQAPTAA